MKMRRLRNFKATINYNNTENIINNWAKYRKSQISFAPSSTHVKFNRREHQSFRDLIATATYRYL